MAKIKNTRVLMEHILKKKAEKVKSTMLAAAEVYKPFTYKMIFVSLQS